MLAAAVVPCRRAVVVGRLPLPSFCWAVARQPKIPILIILPDMADVTAFKANSRLNKSILVQLPIFQPRSAHRPVIGLNHTERDSSLTSSDSCKEVRRPDRASREI